MVNIFSLNPHFFITLALSIINAIVLCFVGYKFLQIIQVTGYKISGFYKWIYDTKARYISRIFFLSLLSFACLMVCNCVFNAFNLSPYYSYIGLIFYFFFSSVFVFKMFTPVKKTPLKYTSRMMRMLSVLMIISGVATFFLIAWGQASSSYIRFSLIALTPIALFILVPIVYYLLLPFEAIIKKFYLIKANNKLKKLQKNKSLIKVGITGSFGKTSTKFILETMLKEKYNVCVSPASFNTPMGISKVINNDLNEKHDVLICEMGARHRHDIEKLAKLVKPNVAVITAVGEQHIKTFKSIENIAKTKFELVENLDPKGFVVFNYGEGENKFISEMYDKTLQEKYKTGVIDGYDLIAKDINVNAQGTTFILVNKTDGTSVECSTILLGIHNIENILAAAMVSFKLGLTMAEVKIAISKLKPVSHRLELINGPTGITVLDDSYNSSVVGCSMALNVLSKFKGKKVILTPGLVEMGKSQFEANFNIGNQIAKVVDIAIIENEINKDAITKGLLAAGFDESNIIYAKDLEEAKSIMVKVLKPGDTILFENDLPDNFV